MKDDSNFRIPELSNPKTGMYLTESQLQLFLNGPNAISLIENDDLEWRIYKRDCEVWNLMYDSLGNSAKDLNGYLSWDPIGEQIKVDIVPNSSVDLFLKEHKIK